MFIARPAKARVNAEERMRMKPAQQTRPTRRAISLRTSARSKASRSAKSFGFTKSASTPAARTRRAGPADWSLAPRPGRPREGGRPRASRDELHAALAGDDLADPRDLLPRAAQGSRGLLRVGGGNDHHVADAHVEGPEHLGVLHPARLTQGLEDRGRRPGAAHESRPAPGREHAGNVAGDAASGHV